MNYVDAPIRVTEILQGTSQAEQTATRSFVATRFSNKKMADDFYQEYGDCLIPEDIDNVVIYAVEQPPRIVVMQTVIVTANQD